MIFVVDTSVILKWFVGEVDQERAYTLLTPGKELAAPDFAMIETANVLWRKQRQGDIGEIHVDRALANLHRFFKHIARSSDLVEPALTLARELRHSVYDCIFLALTTRLPDAILVTADDRFIAKTASTRYAPLVRPLSSFALSKDQ